MLTNLQANQTTIDPFSSCSHALRYLHTHSMNSKWKIQAMKTVYESMPKEFQFQDLTNISLTIESLKWNKSISQDTIRLEKEAMTKYVQTWNKFKTRVKDVQTI